MNTTRGRFGRVRISEKNHARKHRQTYAHDGPYIYRAVRICAYCCLTCARAYFVRMFAHMRILTAKDMDGNIFDTYVSYAPNVSADDCELEEISLGRALVSAKWRKQVEALRAEKDTAKKKRMKSGLPCITPGGTFSHVGRGGLNRASGYLCADIDCKPEKGINADLDGFDLKAAVARLPYVAYCGLSCGGSGYFLIVRIQDPSKYKEYYRALQADFERGGITIDRACSNIAFKRYVSWDASPYVNTAAQPYDYTLPEREHYTTREAIGRELGDSETRAKVEAVIRHCEDNGIDITESYGDWVRILAALASEYGADGEEYAHRISRMYGGYSREQTAAKYRSFLHGRQGGAASIGTFFYIARREMGHHDFDGIE